MRGLAWFAGAALALATTLAHADSGGEPTVRISAALGAPSPADIDTALARSFDSPFQASIKGSPDVRIDNCTAWQSWRDRVTGAQPDSDYAALRGQGVQCDALAMVRNAHAPKRSALPADLNALTAARLYPATLWVAVSDDAVAALARPGRTLAAASGVARFKVDRKGLLLEDDAQGIRLVLLARGDFDGDGWEDALYRRQAWLRGGSWSDVRLVLLTRRRAGAPLIELLR